MSRLTLRFDRISVKILLSYLSILFLPLCAIVLIQFTSTHTILEAQKEKNLYTLRQSARLVDIHLEELRHITTYIGADNRTNSIVNRARSGGEDKANVFALYQLVNAFPKYQLTNRMIENVYIFFNDAGYIVKLPSAFPATQYNYDSFVGFRGISYEGMRVLQREPQMGRVLIGAQGAENDFLLLHSFPEPGIPQGLVIIEIREQALQEILRSNDSGLGGVYLLDGNGRVLTSVGESAPPVGGAALESAVGSEGCGELTVDSKRYISTTVTSGDWTYLSLTSRDYLLRDFAYIRYIILAMGLASVTLGAFICIALWQRRHRFYKKVSSYAKSSGLMPIPAKNEQVFLERTVTSFADEVGSLRTSLQQQGELLKNSGLLSLLHGDFGNGELLEKKLAANDLTLAAECYYVVHVLLPDAEALRKWGDSPLSYRLHLKDTLLGLLQIPMLTCDLDNVSLVLILPVQAELSTQAVGKIFLDTVSRLEAADGIFPHFAISGQGREIAEIPLLYRQAMDTREYMTLLGLDGCLTCENLPTGDEVFYYPLTEELRLIQLIRKGDRAELEQFLDMLQRENILRRALPLPMVRELCEALRRNILRALQDTCASGESAELGREIERARSMSDILACAKQVNRSLHQIAELQNEREHMEMRDRLRAAVEEQLANPAFNLYTLSEQLGISENALYRSFKVCFGASFSEYLEQHRIERACRLLCRQIPIKEVASLAGYTSDHTFRRAFKRIIGVLPSQYAS